MWPHLIHTRRQAVAVIGWTAQPPAAKFLFHYLPEYYTLASGSSMGVVYAEDIECIIKPIGGRGGLFIGNL